MQDWQKILDGNADGHILGYAKFGANAWKKADRILVECAAVAAKDKIFV